MAEGAKEWSSWTSLHIEYGKSERRLGRGISKLKEKPNDIENEVKLQLERSMMREVKEDKKIIKNKALYNFNSLTEEEIEGYDFLTDKQKQIAKLELKYDDKTIASKLGCYQSYVHDSFKRILSKIEIYEKHKELSVLSPRERKIYKLQYQGKSRQEIAKKLGTSSESIRVSEYKINNKINKSVTKHVKNNIRD